MLGATDGQLDAELAEPEPRLGNSVRPDNIGKVGRKTSGHDMAYRLGSRPAQRIRRPRRELIKLCAFFLPGCSLAKPNINRLASCLLCLTFFLLEMASVSMGDSLRLFCLPACLPACLFVCLLFLDAPVRPISRPDRRPVALVLNITQASGAGRSGHVRPPRRRRLSRRRGAMRWPR